MEITQNMSVIDDVKTEEKHCIFNEDPGDLIQYVYKEIDIVTVDGVSHRGWVYTVDPVSLSFGLIQFVEGQDYRIELIMGHAIKCLTILNSDVEKHKDRLDSLFKPASIPIVSSTELTSRRERVVSWLVRNRIPVQCFGDQLSIGEVLFINPPYAAEDCQSSNEIVLGKIQGLLKNIPNIETEGS